MEVYERISVLSKKKCNQNLNKQFISALLSGCFLAFGACCSIRVGGHIENSDIGYQRIVSGIFGLPIGLLLIVLYQTQLFTGNTAFYTIGFLEKKIFLKRMMLSFAIVYIGNLLGSILFAYMVYHSQILNNSPSILSLAELKVSSNWSVTFMKGILCNWFVCLSLWQASCGNSVIDKAIGIFLPISGFVTMGLEHCVANMYIIPQGMILGANVTIIDFIVNNLIPVTLGNIISGVLFVGVTSYIFFHANSSNL